MQKKKLTAHEIVLRQKRRRKRERIIKEVAGCVLLSSLLFGMVAYAFETDDYSLEYPEHYGQIQYCGVWFDYDDYNAMMAEREAYLEAERAEEQAFYEKLTAIREREEMAQETSYQSHIHSRDWEASESYLLAKLAMAEMESECIECKMLVICTVLNRVWSKDFPNTIEEVIYEEHDGVYQFSPVGNGRFDLVEPDAECWDALDMVMAGGWDESYGATYFELTSSNPTWHSKNLHRLFEHCNTTFYKEDK